MPKMLQAIQDKIIAADIEIKDTTDSGIYVGQAIETPISVVISKGHKVSDEIKPGQKILWWRDKTTEFEWSGGWKLNILSEDDVVGIIDDGQQFDVVVRASDET